MPTGRTRTLGDLQRDGYKSLTVLCDDCSLQGCYAVSRLIVTHGADRELSEVLERLSCYCARRGDEVTGNQCGARFRFDVE
jgi:hypothetical protein